MKNQYLILSHKHELVPFSQRLRREGHDVEVVVARANYERAWEGKARKVLKASEGQVTRENLGPAIEAARRGEVAVMTSLYQAVEWFEGSPYLWPTLDTEPCSDVLQFGGWFHEGQVSAPHLLVVDWGAWPGGLGAWIPSALTLVRVDRVPPFVVPVVNDVLKILTERSFQGLFKFALKETTSGGLELAGLDMGWHPLHAHAFVAELESLSGLLRGGPAILNERFVVVNMLTTPPWPASGQGTVVDIGGLTPDQRGSVWWHDVAIDQGNRKLRTAGTDGRIGIVVGSDWYLEMARAKALEVCGRAQLPEKQFRVDAANIVANVLCSLKDRYGFLL